MILEFNIVYIAIHKIIIDWVGSPVNEVFLHFNVDYHRNDLLAKRSHAKRRF